MVTIDTIKRGTKNGFVTVWELGKVIIPVYLIITFLKYTPILDMISNFFQPVMKIFGLPGEAALALVLGNFLSLYAGVGAIASLELTTKQVTIAAVMLSFSHSLLIESAVSKKIGVSVLLVVSVRVILAIMFGIVLNLAM